MHTIELTKLARNVASAHADTDDVGENPHVATAGDAVTINVAAIRCFYKRHEDRPGTRITFTDGGGFAVSESYDDVKARIAEAQASVSPIGGDERPRRGR